MARTMETHASEPIERNSARVAESIGQHRTFWLGVLYVLTITAVLAFVTRF
jgi:hypothetical protein